MATTVYVDAALQTGNNDGTSWEDAYRGCAGLQTALDNVVNGSDTIIYIRNAFSVGTYGSTMDIDTAGGDYTNNNWLRIVGCDDTTGFPLLAGQYVTLDGENLLSGDLVNVSSRNMIWFENIHFTRASASNKAGCYLTATAARYGYNFINCKFSYCYYGLNLSSLYNRNVSIINSLFVNNSIVDLTSFANQPIVMGCFFNSSANSILAITGATIRDCIFQSALNSGSVVAVNGTGVLRGEAVVTNCTFYCTGTGGITAISFGNNYVGPIITNNIICLAQPASDIPVSAARVSYEDYNSTNASVNLLTGEHSLNATDPQFADAASGDFRPRNPLVLRGGMPDIAGNPTQIGAIQGKYQFISKTKTANLGRLAIIR